MKRVLRQILTACIAVILVASVIGILFETALFVHIAIGGVAISMVTGVAYGVVASHENDKKHRFRKRI